MPRTKINLIDFASRQKKISAASIRLRRVFQIKVFVRVVLVGGRQLFSGRRSGASTSHIDGRRPCYSLRFVWRIRRSYFCSLEPSSRSDIGCPNRRIISAALSRCDLSSATYSLTKKFLNQTRTTLAGRVAEYLRNMMSVRADINPPSKSDRLRSRLSAFSRRRPHVDATHL